MQTIALIDYGSGNVRSVARALAEGARRAGRVCDVRLTSDADFVARADRIVLPGQGAFHTCMDGLSANAPLLAAMTEAVRGRGAPFLGICVGFQLLANKGLEHGERKGLGWLGGVCRKIETGPAERVPHMGWNEAIVTRAHPVLAPLAPQRHVYFCHSFVLAPPESAVLAQSAHGERFCCAAGEGNIVGVQFHPEKSQDAGLALLSAFADWKPQ